MKKRSYSTRLGVLALALTLITTCLVGSTMAKYVSEVKGTATATVAAWSFKVNGQSETFTNINLASTAYEETTIKNDVIAPGTKGSFDIVIDGTGSEVGIEYAVAIALKGSPQPSLPDDLTFSLTEITADNAGHSFSDFIADSATSTALKNTIAYNSAANAMKKTITIYWNWDFGASDTTANNDNAYQDQDWTFDITITGTQTAPTAAPAT